MDCIKGFNLFPMPFEVDSGTERQVRGLCSACMARGAAFLSIGLMMCLRSRVVGRHGLTRDSERRLGVSRRGRLSCFSLYPMQRWLRRARCVVGCSLAVDAGCDAAGGCSARAGA